MISKNAQGFPRLQSVSLFFGIARFRRRLNTRIRIPAIEALRGGGRCRVAGAAPAGGRPQRRWPERSPRPSGPSPPGRPAPSGGWRRARPPPVARARPCGRPLRKGQLEERPSPGRCPLVILAMTMGGQHGALKMREKYINLDHFNILEQISPPETKGSSTFLPTFYFIVNNNILLLILLLLLNIIIVIYKLLTNHCKQIIVNK